MFVDLVFKFCCSKRTKQDSLQTQPRVEQDPVMKDQETHDFGQFFDTQRKTQLSRSIEKKNLQNPDAQAQNDQENNMRLKVSLEMKMDNNSQAIEQYLILGEGSSKKIGSYEYLEKSGGSMVNQQQTYNFVVPMEQEGQNQMYQQIQGYYNQQTRPPEQNYGEMQNLRRSNSNVDLKSADNGLKKKIKKDQEKSSGKKRNVKIWTTEEDETLRKQYKEFSGNWQKIAAKLPGRNISQCSQRWRRINPIQIKQKWSFEEDERVIKLVDQHGKNWVKIAIDFPGRTGKQIRERYMNKLDPALRIEPWSKEEDQIILEMYKKEGNKWSTIAASLKGRSENMVKNRFYSYIKRVVLGQTNPYQIVYSQKQNQNHMEEENGVENSNGHHIDDNHVNGNDFNISSIDHDGSLSSFEQRNNFSENNTYSSISTFSHYDTYELDPYVDDGDFPQQFHDKISLNYGLEESSWSNEIK